MKGRQGFRRPSHFPATQFLASPTHHQIVILSGAHTELSREKTLDGAESKDPDSPATEPNESTALPFVIPSAAKRSGATCGSLDQHPNQPEAPLVHREHFTGFSRPYGTTQTIPVLPRTDVLGYISGRPFGTGPRGKGGASILCEGANDSTPDGVHCSLNLPQAS